MAAMANARPTGHRTAPPTRTDVGEPSDPPTERPTPRAMKPAAINRRAVIRSPHPRPSLQHADPSRRLPGNAGRRRRRIGSGPCSRAFSTHRRPTAPSSPGPGSRHSWHLARYADGDGRGFDRNPEALRRFPITAVQLVWAFPIEADLERSSGRHVHERRPLWIADHRSPERAPPVQKALRCDDADLELPIVRSGPAEQGQASEHGADVAQEDGARLPREPSATIDADLQREALLAEVSRSRPDVPEL